MKIAFSKSEMNASESYPFALKLIEAGKLDEASEVIRVLREASESDRGLIYLRALLSVRVALKSGHKTINDDQISPHVAPDNSLRAEAYMVNGLLACDRGEYDNGALNFLRASEVYRVLGREDRELLARFNHLMLKGDGGEPLSIEAQLDELRSIEASARHGDHHRVLGLVLRQKAFLLFERQLFEASLIEIKKALEPLELHSPKSDYHIGLVHAADCCLELGRSHEAKGWLEFISRPVESRVEFPLECVEAKLAGRTIDPARASTATAYWQRRSAKVRTDEQRGLVSPLEWLRSQSLIKDPTTGRSEALKANSIEGKLLTMLSQSHVTKARLCEALWPEHSDLTNLDNRFHRLISRLNKKLPGLVNFDGERYFLPRALELK